MANKIIEYVMNTPENTNPAVLNALVKELLTVKKLKDISVRELLSIEDGFYKLEKPIEYIVDGATKTLCSVEGGILHNNYDGYSALEFSTSQIEQPTVGNTYNVKLEFSSGLTIQKDIECEEISGMPAFLFDNSMFDNLYVSPLNGMGVVQNPYELRGMVALTTTADENRAKYGDSVVVTITYTESSTGEISGVVNINTDVKILDGITKVITSLADDTSYYIENVWQDGDTLEVSAMDEGSEGGGDEDEKFKVYLAGDGSVDTTKTGMSGVDVYNELIKHDDGNKKIKNCVIIFDDGTELTEGLVNTMQVHVDGQIKEQRVPLFPINGTKWWQIGEDGYGSIEYRSA